MLRLAYNLVVEAEESSQRNGELMAYPEHVQRSSIVDAILGRRR